MGGLREDIRPALGRISCETLLLWGGQDRVLPLQVGRDLERRIAGARLEIWDGVGHGPMVEQPRRFNERIARFARG